MRAGLVAFHSVKLRFSDISVDLFVQDFIIMSNTNNNKRLLKAFRPIRKYWWQTNKSASDQPTRWWLERIKQKLNSKKPQNEEVVF